jgi:multiple antibiotic resistance protein
MLQSEPRLNATRRRRPVAWHARHFVAFTVGCAGLVSACAAGAAEAVAGQLPPRQFPVAHIFTFLFVMLGPFKIIHPFAKITKGTDAAFTYRVALLGTFFASLALLIAAMLGERMLHSYGIPVPVLALSAGIILFLVALQTVLQQFTAPASHGDEAGVPAAVSAVKVAMSPLAFPTIVTPYGIATLVVFLALSPDLQARLIVGALMAAIMVLNLAVMLIARHILPALGFVLPILGAVLGVVQVALGLQIINNSLKALGVM